MRLITRAAAFLLTALSSATSHAYTAESGFWWNPAEPGTGLAIEIQDNFLFLAGYVYTASGAPTFVTSQGTMRTSTEFTSTLDVSSNGAAIGAPWRQITTTVNAAGPISIIFNANDETAATLTWGGRTTPLKRFVYALGNTEQQLMLGEWNVTADLATLSGYSDFPFIGDLFVFTTVQRRANVDYFEGCRPANSLVARCTSADISKHDASGFYDAARDEHVLIVKDLGASSSSPAVYFAYYLDVGTDQFDGVLEIYNGGETPGNGPYYPVRGFRSASKSFVLTGNGPSEAGKSAAIADRSISQSILKGRALPDGLTAAEVKAKYDIDVDAHRAAVQVLASDMMARDQGNAK